MPAIQGGTYLHPQGMWGKHRLAGEADLQEHY